MDLNPVFQPLIAALWYLLPLAIMTGLIKSPWFKGKFGEFLVNLSARWFLDKSRYRLIKNVTLPTEDGTTQIDHVPVSEFGVFVVETKNMRGWIFGGAHPRLFRDRDKACARYNVLQGEVH
ncbi:nuclease-related domain-containing protein [Marinobacter guineae]|uniref:nuclease-related domain-containing protein n=1 Tax=Marinobacter guineae TaxID=432303 RepID=UPI002244FC6B|nr:nuclease-related domain-containing protein [Marinobacter guineae]